MSEYTANNIDQLSEIDAMSCKSIDIMYRDVVQLLVNANNHLPLIRKNDGTKPYWSKSLSIACRNKKLAWRAWVQTVRPRDDDSQVWIITRNVRNCYVINCASRNTNMKFIISGK